MNLRKHMILVVGGGAALVCLGAAIYLLIRYEGSYGRVHESFKNVEMHLNTMANRDPFPSEENIAIVRKNHEAIKGFFAEFQDKLQQGQVEPESIEPAQFDPLLEKVIRRLNTRAATTGVKLPDRFAYGADVYAAGAQPAAASVPRLVVQVKTIEALCDLLMDARVIEIVSIDREVFESTAAEETADTSSGRRGVQVASAGGAPVNQRVPLPETSPLYTSERVVVTFLARERAAWDVLNALAKSKSFSVISDVVMENALAPLGTPPPVPVIPVPVAATPGALPAFPSHEDRIAAGREPVKVSLVVDVYRFVKESQGEEAKP